MATDNNRWSCHACTFDNPQQRSDCEICGTKRLSKPPGSYGEHKAEHVEKQSALSPLSKKPPPKIFSRTQHEIKPLHLRLAAYDVHRPIPTNKPWGALLLEPCEPVWTHPYCVFVDHQQNGLSVCRGKKVKGDRVVNAEHCIRYYFCEPRIGNVGFTSTELQSSGMDYNVTNFDEFGCTLRLSRKGAGIGRSSITLPLTMGMAYVTALYERQTPVIYTQHAILSVNGRRDGVVVGQRFKIELNNGQFWNLWSVANPIKLRIHGQKLVAEQHICGVLRLAEIPNNDAESESLLEAYSGCWPVGGYLSIESAPDSDRTSYYSITWKVSSVDENNKDLLHFALPHQQNSFVKGNKTSLRMETTTKGTAFAYVGSKWDFQVQRSNIEFLPPTKCADKYIQDYGIREHLVCDASSNFDESCHVNSYYFSGKSLQKYALLALVADELKESRIRDQCLGKLKRTFQAFLDNDCTAFGLSPLVYDETWRGIRSSAHPGNADFGNPDYNDHHFHYGYFIFAAAVIRKYDEEWGLRNTDFVEALIRDVANPSTHDSYFPTFRSFDWFHGHSWSHGISPSADGKDEESTSEDINFYYAMKLWGLVAKDTNLTHLADVMISVLENSINQYFQMTNDNENHPEDFIRNKVTGILFDNKCDYATWFSAARECIHGIQMLPCTAITELVRPVQFVKEEWEERLENLECVRNPSKYSGWTSILFTNLASIQKLWALEVLADPKCPMDDGLTRTWALFYAATRPE